MKHRTITTFQIQHQSCQHRYVIYNLACRQAFILCHNSPISSPATQRTPLLGRGGRGGHWESEGVGFMEVPIIVWELGQVMLSLVTSRNGSPLPGHLFIQQHLLIAYYVPGTIPEAMDSGEQG